MSDANAAEPADSTPPSPPSAPEPPAALSDEELGRLARRIWERLVVGRDGPPPASR